MHGGSLRSTRCACLRQTGCENRVDRGSESSRGTSYVGLSWGETDLLHLGDEVGQASLLVGKRVRLRPAKTAGLRCPSLLEPPVTGVVRWRSARSGRAMHTRADARSSLAPVVPDPRKIKSFRSAAAFEAWMKTNHARETELWL